MGAVFLFSRILLLKVGIFYSQNFEDDS